MPEAAQEQAATVRELIVQLAQAEDALRRASRHGTTPEAVELAHVERGLVEALRERDVQVALGSGAQALISREADGPSAQDDDPEAHFGAAPGDPEQVMTDLTQAVASRTVLGRATGILMERHRLGADAAFERLRTASQQRNVKVRVLAAELVATGQEAECGVDGKMADRAVVARAQGILMERHHLTETAALESLAAAAHRTERPRSWVAERVVTTGVDPADLPADRTGRSGPPEFDPGSAA